MRIYTDTTEELADLFSALAHPLRLRLMRLLLVRPMCVCRLAAALGVPQPTVSRNLKLLRKAGLLKAKQCRTFVRYSAAEWLGDLELKPLHDLVREFVSLEYNEKAVDAELRRLGKTEPKCD